MNAGVGGGGGRHLSLFSLRAVLLDVDNRTPRILGEGRGRTCRALADCGASKDVGVFVISAQNGAKEGGSSAS